jgi:pimeloyl-ACP methyl ester carboxylesterase
MVFVLVHSPLVGPSTWRPVARELERRGHRTTVPSLLDGTTRRTWQSDAQAVLDVLGGREPIILVGHSGGGLLLPVIADAAVSPVAELVFVDSDVPPKNGAAPFMPARFLEEFRKLAVDGLLPPWSEWWGEDVMRDLVPDEKLRADLVRETPSLPLAYLEQRIPSPRGWDEVPCAYLLLSEAYQGAAAEAVARGWPVEKLPDAQHLHIAVAPRAVADALIRLHPPSQ